MEGFWCNETVQTPMLRTLSLDVHPRSVDTTLAMRFTGLVWIAKGLVFWHRNGPQRSCSMPQVANACNYSVQAPGPSTDLLSKLNSPVAPLQAWYTMAAFSKGDGI